MPISGTCEFDLVEAASNKPLFSKVDNFGQLWYCGEEEVEFFLRIRNHSEHEMSICNLTVDGMKMGYSQCVKRENGAVNLGIISRDGSSFTAFAFTTVPQLGGVGSDGEDEDAPLANTLGGSITFDWQESQLSEVAAVNSPPTYDFAQKTNNGSSIEDEKKSGVGLLGAKAGNAKTVTGGGGWAKFTSTFVVSENFVINVPKSYKLEAAGPVMCAGITVYDPLCQHGVKAGDRVGIVGLGGLGVMGVKIAKALGCSVSVISRNEKKRKLATGIGCDGFIVSKDEEAMRSNEGTLDIIINTIPCHHNYQDYQTLLDRKSRIGKQVLLGLHEGLVAGIIVDKLTFGRSRLTGSGIGGIKNTQAIMDLCAKHEIYPELEIVGCDKINEVYEKLDKSNDDGKRYVIDIENTLKADVVCKHGPPNLSENKGMTFTSVVGEVLKTIVTFRWW